MPNPLPDRTAYADGQYQRSAPSSLSASKPKAKSEISGVCGPTTIILMGIVVAAIVFLGRLLLRSDDGDAITGKPPVIAVMQTADVHALLITASDPDYILFGSHAGIHESQDGGYTWSTGTLQGTDAMNIASSPNAPETAYVAGHDVLQISSDRGVTWQPLAHNLPGTDIHAFAQDPIQPQRLYAFVVGAGIYVSADGGLNWQAIANQPGEGAPVALASDGATLYAAMPLGIAASSDGGRSWTPLPAQPHGGAISLVISATNPRVLIAGTTTGIAKSENGGQSWTTLAQTGIPVVSVTLAPSNPDRLLAVALTGELFRSDDGGITWAAPRTGQ